MKIHIVIVEKDIQSNKSNIPINKQFTQCNSDKPMIQCSTCQQYFHRGINKQHFKNITVF